MILTVSGPPGSGKSTVAKILADKLQYRYFSAGEIFRECAKARGLSLEDFGTLAENDWSIDRELDAKLLAEMRNAENVVFDARLAGVLAHVHGISAVKVYITAGVDERARRIAQREGKDVSIVREEMLTREQSESRRYREIYGYDPSVREIYDVYIDSTALSVEQVVSAILERISRFQSVT